MCPRRPRLLVHVSSAMDTTIKNRALAIIEDSGEIRKFKKVHVLTNLRNERYLL